jgi:hypothetical protein
MWGMKAAIALLRTTLSEALFTNTTGFSGHGPPGAKCPTTLWPLPTERRCRFVTLSGQHVGILDY